jgi:hypothetical protein
LGASIFLPAPPGLIDSIGSLFQGYLRVHGIVLISVAIKINNAGSKIVKADLRRLLGIFTAWVAVKVVAFAENNAHIHRKRCEE